MFRGFATRSIMTLALAVALSAGAQQSQTGTSQPTKAGTTQPGPAAKAAAPGKPGSLTATEGEQAGVAVKVGATSDTATPKKERPPNQEAQVLQEKHDTWAYPLFKAAPAQSKQITVIEHYPYTEATFVNPVRIESHPATDDSYTSAEQSMVSRTAAMMRLDYDTWLQDWDEPSGKLTQETQSKQGVTKEKLIEQWNGIFRAARFELVRRIDTGPYVLLTYRLMVGAKPAFNAEFPVIFHQVDGRWVATQDLRSDQLVQASPWFSGQKQMEIDVRINRPMTDISTILPPSGGAK